MPVHDWTRVDPGIFHAFHHSWIEEIARALNRGLLPEDYYALPEQYASGFGPDVLTLQGTGDSEEDEAAGGVNPGSSTAVLAAPRMPPVGETDMAFYRHKQKSVVVRHVSGDRIVAMVEIVSPGNKSSLRAIRAFVEKAAALHDNGIQLLVIDPHPLGRRDPQGIHGEIWEKIAGEEYTAPEDKQLTLAAYESGLSVRAYVIHFGVGDALADMPLFLEPQKTVTVPLEATYIAAFAAVPRRWRRVLEAAGPADPR